MMGRLYRVAIVTTCGSFNSQGPVALIDNWKVENASEKCNLSIIGT